MMRLCTAYRPFFGPERHQTPWHASKDYGPHACQVSPLETLFLQSCSGEGNSSRKSTHLDSFGDTNGAHLDASSNWHPTARRSLLEKGLARNCMRLPVVFSLLATK